jgi:mevalonate kinase
VGVGRGYGKLLLFGEHAAVYGHPALGIRLDDYLEVEIEPDTGPCWSMPDLGDRERELIGTILAQLHSAPASGCLKIRGTLPMSIGFGSSAAFCTALLRATGSPAARNPRSLWREAHRLEHAFHGTPSGIDTGLSVYSGPSLITPAPPGLPRRKPARLPRGAVLVGAVRRTSSTADLVASIRDRRRHDENGVESALVRLGELAVLAGTGHTCPDAATLGRAATEAQSLLAGLGLSTSALDAALETMRQAGAYGAKLSGAGGGGAFYGVFESIEQAETGARALRRGAAQAEIIYLRTITIGDQPKSN